MVSIYKITSPEGKIYIGQSSNIEYRIKKYRYWDCKSQRRLYFSIVRHGWDAHTFEVIETCNPVDGNDRERYWQEFYNATGENGLNLMLTQTKKVKAIMPKESRDIISFKNSGSKNGMFGKQVTESVKQKQREKLSGELNYLSKWILNTNTGIFYPCLQEAADSIGISKGTLWSKMVKAKTKTTPFIYV